MEEKVKELYELFNKKEKVFEAQQEDLKEIEELENELKEEVKQRTALERGGFFV